MSSRSNSRNMPNIIITGTPGVGKSSIAKLVSEKSGLNWIDVSKFAIENQVVKEFDETYNCPVIEEKALLKLLKSRIKEGNNILDFYSSDIFLRKWIDIVFVIRADNSVLYDRLTARGYSSVKLKNNLEYEIHGLSYEEASEKFDPDIVHIIENNTEEQLTDTVERICTWIKMWLKNET